MTAQTITRRAGKSPSGAQPDGRPRWLADLQGLARARLGRAGVVQVAAFAGHTFESRFFSFRRDGVTGRLVACIWIR